MVVRLSWDPGCSENIKLGLSNGSVVESLCSGQDTLYNRNLNRIQFNGRVDLDITYTRPRSLNGGRFMIEVSGEYVKHILLICMYIYISSIPDGSYIATLFMNSGLPGKGKQSQFIL